YSHIQKLSFSFFDGRPVGKILARIMGDISALQQFFSNAVTNFLPELLTIVSVTFIMLYLNYKLALVTLAMLPVLFVGMFYIETKSRKRWDINRKKRSNLNAFTHEDFSGIRVVKSFTQERNTFSKYKNYVGEVTDSFISAVRIQDTFWSMVEISWGLGMVIVYLYSISLINDGSISVGTLIAFTMYVGMFWRPIVNITNFYNSLVTSFSAADRIFEILDIKPDIIQKEDALKMPEIKGSVEFENVSFEYDRDSQVLHNVSFRVKKGEAIAFVGPTGAGKTTIINLISRFYDPTSGTVRIDDTDISKTDVESMRSQMGIMLQDTFLFSSTIKENIRYGKLNATDEEVKKAAETVGIDKFIENLENGYDTEVNERGSRLSVGERQLISLARAVLADPKILILDEATSNIDTNTEIMVQKGIKKLLQGRTSFVIAHRLSTIRDADRIMYIDEGSIKEQGTHKELMAKKGKYYELYMSQFKFLYEGV
ncbi:MAG TPA: ABC transporter ATP-binding protein, partial [Tepiditoga sp.]|nr:ABC transporter ATP-binding protein [Tepiditoga sp.]